MAAQKILKMVFSSLIGLEVGLALAYLMSVRLGAAAPVWLDFNGMRSLPSLLQAAHLFAIGGIALGLLLFRQRMPRPLSWLLPLSLALLCFYGGIDELTKIHLQLKQYNWQHIYLAILVAIPILCWRDLIWLWRAHRSIVLWVLTGITVFLLGGFGAQAMQDALHQAFRTDATIALAGQQVNLQVLAEHIRIAVEELAELLGETLILFGVALFALKTLTAPPTSGVQA